MNKLRIAWAVTWRMIGNGVMLGIGFGAIYGPISMMILYTADALSGRYTLLDFPVSSAVTYSILAIFVGAGAGCFFGFLGGTISGLILTLGILSRKGYQLKPSPYRNVIIALCIIGSIIIVVLPLTQAIIGPSWFFTGQGEGVALFALAILPGVLAAFSTWWATMRVVRWWEKSRGMLQATTC